MQEKTSHNKTEAELVGLKIPHAKIMRMNTRSTTGVIVKGKGLENVNMFKFLGSYLTEDAEIEREILSDCSDVGCITRVGNDIEIKRNLYESNVHSVLLYATETWRTIKR